MPQRYSFQTPPQSTLLATSLQWLLSQRHKTQYILGLHGWLYKPPWCFLSLHKCHQSYGLLELKCAWHLRLELQSDLKNPKRTRLPESKEQRINDKFIWEAKISPPPHPFSVSPSISLLRLFLNQLLSPFRSCTFFCRYVRPWCLSSLFFNFHLYFVSIAHSDASLLWNSLLACVFETFVNIKTTMSDQHRISPYNINTKSSRQVMWIKKTITWEIISWSNTKLSELTS